VAGELDDFHDAAAQADEARYFAHFAPDGVFLGTDATERWTASSFRVYAHPYFARGKAWSFRGVRRRIAARGEVAWFEEDLETEKLGPARGSGVMVRSGDRWLVEQYVLSVVVPNEKFKAVKELLER
jgi:SnoaL-like protein